MPNTKAEEQILDWMRNNTDRVIELARMSSGPMELQVRIIYAMERERLHKRSQFRAVGIMDVS